MKKKLKPYLTKECNIRIRGKAESERDEKKVKKKKKERNVVFVS